MDTSPIVITTVSLSSRSFTFYSDKKPSPREIRAMLRDAGVETDDATDVTFGVTESKLHNLKQETR